jgi:hypothetical protein
MALRRTLAVRPDLVEAAGGLGDDDRALLAEFTDPGPGAQDQGP